MIYQKRGMWKSTYLPQKFHSRAEAERAEAEHLDVPLPPPPPPPPLPPEEGLTPLERLRGHKICEDCNCDPCECVDDMEVHDRELLGSEDGEAR